MKYNFSVRTLLEAGAHYGHRKNLWNPKMESYIYGVRNGIHIIDLGQTAPMLHKALEVVRQVAAKNGRILLVGTKRQGADAVAREAMRCGQYYVNHRWLGGMLTNWSTVSASIKTLQEYEERLAQENSRLTKKERLELDRKRQKLARVLDGIRNLGGKPDLLFVLDTNMEHLAIDEAKKLGIPVIAIADTNSNPDGVDYVVPGNDDARKAIELYLSLIADAALEGLQEGMQDAGVDIGASENPEEQEAAFSGDGGKQHVSDEPKLAAQEVEATETVEGGE